MNNLNTNHGEQVIEIRKLEQYLSNIKIINELGQGKPRAEILKSYKGFGGLRKCFNSKQLYGMLMREIRTIFGKEQEHVIFDNLRNSCKSAYYTPSEIVKFIYKYLTDVCNFKGGDILEPACGNGAFFEFMPENIKQKSNITGIEIDLLTGKLVKAIYSNINVINEPIQKINFIGQKFDLIIGNPPYSDELVIDDFMPDISNFTIHHYFIAKCVRLLKDDGILAFVMPSYWLDIPRKNTRAIINNEAVLIDAFRLPDNLFEQATVTVDIVFIRKSGNKIHNFTDSALFEYEGKKDYVNTYWKDRPFRILGNLGLKWVECYQRYVPTCSTPDKQKILDYLSNYQADQNTKDDFLNIVGQSQNLQKLKDVLLKFRQQICNIAELQVNNFSAEIQQLLTYTDQLITHLE